MLLIAKKTFAYPQGIHSKHLEPGDTFEAKDRYARTLLAAGLAEVAPAKSRKYKRRDMTAEDSREFE